MPIPESQLDTWSGQGSTGQFTDTYNSMRNNLLDTHAPYPLKHTDVFLQGSYKNDTNVYGDSDVDIVLYYTGGFYRDLTEMSPADQQAYNAAAGAAHPYDYARFKQEAADYIQRLYKNVNPGKKAVYIPGSGNRRNADVLVAYEFRRYYEFKSWQNQRYKEGVCFFTPNGVMIENFPKLHSDNCTAKHQATKNWFKPMVRIFKNMRNTMIDQGLLAEGVAPSYFIEGMIYNVPDDQFGGTFRQTWLNCFNHIVQADRDKLVCANYMHWLVRDDKPTSWPSANFNAFLNAASGFWDNY